MEFASGTAYRAAILYMHDVTMRKFQKYFGHRSIKSSDGKDFLLLHAQAAQGIID
jgi:hypothetical protein